MTPEEKAFQLYEKFRPICASNKAAYECVVECVGQIIMAVRDFDDELYTHEGVRMTSHREYYENVLSFIKKSQ